MMRNSFARSPLTWRIQDRWLCAKPWMSRISGPFGLPHSCAEIVRPSGVFTLIGLYFGFCARLGCTAATSSAAATVDVASPVRMDIVMANPPLVLCLDWQPRVARAAQARNANQFAHPITHA